MHENLKILDTRNFYLISHDIGQTLEEVAQRGCGISVLESVQD